MGHGLSAGMPGPKATPGNSVGQGDHLMRHGLRINRSGIHLIGQNTPNKRVILETASNRGNGYDPGADNPFGFAASDLKLLTFPDAQDDGGRRCVKLCARFLWLR